MKTNEHRKIRRTCYTVMIIILFLVILLMAGVPFQKTIDESKKLDIWIGQYVFSDAFEHNSGEIHYCVDYEIIIYRDGGRYYAELEGNGWFLQTRSLAYIEGNENSIDIIFKNTLPGDSLYGREERYEVDELMLTLFYDGSELISTWHALRREHPVYIEGTKEIKGNYFEKIV
ncbi:MAG: hypothetical protein HFI50_17635 [Lachnospiraceae bacterium]|nr:hypothetical protein [Lachnospiraceae bacterium]